MCGSVYIYRSEDMQDGVNVPALGGRIPDRDTHTHTISGCSKVSQTQAHPPLRHTQTRVHQVAERNRSLFMVTVPQRDRHGRVDADM